MMKQKIKQTLKELGIRPDLDGYRYIVDAVQYMLAANNFTGLGVWNVYSAVGKKYGKSEYQVERCIRTAIERIYDTCEPDAIASVFGSRTRMDKGKLTNKEFLWTLADYIADASEGMEGMA